MAPLVWLVPLQPSPAQLKITTAVLRRQDIGCEVVPLDQVQDRLALAPPWGALVHGGRVTPDLVDVQRWLTNADIPTIVLAHDLNDHFESVLLDRGAHDVVALPAAGRKLGSRIGAMVRALSTPLEQRLPESVTIAGRIDVAPRARSARVGPLELELTKSEFDLLLTLALRQGEVVSRDELVGAATGSTLSPRALESHLSRIRIKLREAGAADVLVSVRGVGYRIKAG